MLKLTLTDGRKSWVFPERMCKICPTGAGGSTIFWANNVDSQTDVRETPDEIAIMIARLRNPNSNHPTIGVEMIDGEVVHLFLEKTRLTQCGLSLERQT